jgi:hypothetical protein
MLLGGLTNQLLLPRGADYPGVGGDCNDENTEYSEESEEEVVAAADARAI